VTEYNSICRKELSSYLSTFLPEDETGSVAEMLVSRYEYETMDKAHKSQTIKQTFVDRTYEYNTVFMPKCKKRRFR
jgi:hypothetical protein